MSLNNFPNDTNIGYNIVVGGHKGDAPPDQSGTMKCVDPLRHSSSISHEEMPFITMLRSPTGASQEETAFPPEPGTCVAVSWTTGDPTSRAVIGMPNETNNTKSISGNQSVVEHIMRAAAYATGKITSKGSTTKNERGAIIKEVVNGREWTHELSKGLATHAAWFPLAGQILPQIKQIDTAIKQFANIPGSEALSALPGQFMNLASVFQNMTNQQKNKATQNMDSNMLTGLNNMMELMAESDTGNMFFSDGRVDPTTLIENAVELFSQATTMADIIHILGRLRSDTTLHGLDKLQNVEIVVEGVHGNVTLIIDSTGNVTPTSNSSNLVTQSIQSMQSAMGGSQGGGSGKFLFGDASRLVSEAIGRIPPNLRKQILTSVIEGAKRAKFDEVHAKLLKGVNPLSLFT